MSIHTSDSEAGHQQEEDGDGGDPLLRAMDHFQYGAGMGPQLPYRDELGQPMYPEPGGYYVPETLSSSRPPPGLGPALCPWVRASERRVAILGGRCNTAVKDGVSS